MGASLEDYGIEPEDKSLSTDELVDLIKAVGRETYEEVKDEVEDLDPGLSEKQAEEVEKLMDEWEESTSAQRKAIVEGAKEALAGHDNATHGMSREAKDVPDGGIFARWAPFYARQMEKEGRVTNARTKELAEKGLGDTDYTDKFVAETQEKFLGAGQIDAGGALAPEPVSTDFIELLRDTTLVRSLGATSIDLPEGGTKIPVQTEGSNFFWVGELEAPDESKPKFEMRRLEADKLGALVPLSNDLIRRSPQAVEQLVSQDLRSGAVVEEDSAFLFGDGQNGKPKGIYEQTPDSNKFERTTDGGSVGVDTIIRDLNMLAYKVEGAKIEPAMPAYAGSKRTMRYLMSLRGSDSLLFAQQLSNGSLLGAPAKFSTSFPRTLDDSGDGTNDETRLVYGDWAKAVIGDTYNLRIASSQEATVQLGSGWKSMIASDGTVLIMFHEAGLLVRYPKAFAWATGVDYGASYDA